MKKNHANKSVSLGSRFFLYLMGLTFLGIFIVVFFWVQGRISRYEKEVKLLRQTYSDDKRQEIKSKILEIKDYILWLQFSTNKPIAKTLSGEVERLNLPRVESGSGADSFSDNRYKAVRDSILQSRVPVYVLNKSGSIVFSFNPFSDKENHGSGKNENTLLNMVINRSREGIGSLSVFEHNKGGDSTISRVAYFNDRMIPGFRIISFVSGDDIEKVLKVHILDSISKLRFEENEYVFINEISGKALVTHGKFNNPPRDILNSGDTSWVSIFRAQQTSMNHPEGVFYNYRWALLARPGSSVKTSYFSYIPTWKWVIGMGFYEDDVNKVIALRKKELLTELENTLFDILLFLAVSTLICYLFARLFSKNLGKNVELFETFFERAGKENLIIDKSEVSYKEFSFMADAANQMVKEKMQIEEALRESESHYRYLFEQNPVPLMIYELETLKLLSVNEAFTKQYGYSEAEAKNMKVTDLSTEEEKDTIADLINKLKGLTYIGEWHHVKKDGTRIIAEINSHGFMHEGHSSRIAVINDITNRKKAEDEILNLNANLEMKVEERTALLESANKELEAFSYSVSHDLRAPLRHINGFLELLTKRNYQQLDEKGKHYIDSISRASTHMGLLIDSLLNFSRTGRMEMKLDHINMNQLIQEALTMLEQETDGRQIEWKLTPVPDVYADYAMMRQVWVNLLSNAIKYTRKMEMAVIEIGSLTGTNENIFFVRDNGTGFDMNYANKLFGVFQRLHTSEEFEGTGIGLANVRQVIKRHRGRTWAEGEVDKGATFYFSLPCK